MSPLDPETPPPGERWFSLVWLFPIVAVAVALVLLWRDYVSRGPVIEIAFPTAAGLVAGETAIRFRNVDVGRVEDLRFSGDLKQVIVVARIDPDIAPWLDEDAKFWVVRPQVSVRGVTGLDTVISGAYVEGTWDDVKGEPRRSFEGLEEAPPLAAAGPGRTVRLRAAEGGSVGVGAPVFYRQVEVGRIVGKRLSAAGDYVEFDAFVEAPNDARLTEETRFWFVSGAEFTFGAEGARFRIGSLSGLLQGGVAFDDFSRGAAPAAPDTKIFDVFASPYAAQTEALETDPGAQLLVDVYFGRSVRGLSVGASVEYEGIRVGRVVEIAAEIDPAIGRLETRTRLALAPSLIGLPEGDVAGARAFLERAVAAGLRAQLSQGSLLTGALIVRLVEAPETGPAALLPQSEGKPPLMPTVPSDLDAIAGSVQGALQRIEKLPVEALFDNAVTLLDNVNRIVGSDAARATPARALAALDAATELLADPGLHAVPGEAAALISALNEFVRSPELETARADLAAVLASARAVAAELEGSGAATEAAAAVAALRARLEDPALAAVATELQAAAAAGRALLEDPMLRAAPEKAGAALDALTALLADPALRAAPEEARALLASLRAMIESPEIASARADLAATLASARALSAALAENRTGEDAAAAVKALRARLEDPALAGLVAQIDGAAAAATALLADPGLKEAPAALSAALRSATALLDDPALRAAPADAQAALASLRSLLADLEARNAAGELSATLAAARALVEDPALRRLSNEAAETAAALRAILAAPGAADLPAAATDALRATAQLLDRVREDDLSGAAGRALGSVETASAAIAEAAKGAPVLVARISQLAARADAILAAVDIGSELNYETVAAIREIRDAARAITDLADLVQRQPNALILGK